MKKIKHNLFSNQVRELEYTKMKLQGECFFLKSQVNLHIQKLHVYNELKSMGFGLRELNILYNMIKEIAAEYNSIYQTIDYDK